jgi:hypothetical protein
MKNSVFAVKAEVVEPRATIVTLANQKTMYGGKYIASGDTIFVFASENEGGSGLVALGTVVSASAVPRKSGSERQTPRVNVVLSFGRLARQPLGRAELKSYSNWNDGKPQTELNFKLYRQATNKIVGITPAAAAFLGSFF